MVVCTVRERTRLENEYLAWHGHQIKGYSGNLSTSQSLKTDRMEFARNVIGTPPKKIIDFGCSDGSFAVELASSGFEVVAVDFSDVLASFKLQNANVRYMGMNLDEAWVDRLMPESFDVALCLEILEHLLRDYDFLCNVRRILKPSGYMIVSVPLKDNMTIDDHHLRYFPKFSLLKLLRDAGYSKIELIEGQNSLLGVASV